jgi:hypothetical protein
MAPAKIDRKSRLPGRGLNSDRWQKGIGTLLFQGNEMAGPSCIRIAF